ncbi:uncharacterized protein BDZ99DRAFT_572495 [Mytilinidion resinicola]|uniref:F-box domain-containing protein n=1 Tax=Mytilinidion resinicola TaxID=574789 RepID=A0A6A6YFJ2_9PEZI|nr:uncharacterized protein BDZ99DRAFT_572495 [Mytilinidion resinicola]KAF2807571.1 hypothetical protein BDZ99DRAFT_572495 [Mytilinidion resinicola]
MDDARPSTAGILAVAPPNSTRLGDLPDEILVIILSNFRCRCERYYEACKLLNADNPSALEDRNDLARFSQVSRKFAKCAQEILFRDVGFTPYPGLLGQRRRELRRLEALFNVLQRNPGLVKRVRKLNLNIVTATRLIPFLRKHSGFRNGSNMYSAFSAVKRFKACIALVDLRPHEIEDFQLEVG